MLSLILKRGIGDEKERQTVSIGGRFQLSLTGSMFNKVRAKYFFNPLE
jgi:hypothetical protein